MTALHTAVGPPAGEAPTSGPPPSPHRGSRLHAAWVLLLLLAAPVLTTLALQASTGVDAAPRDARIDVAGPGSQALLAASRVVFDVSLMGLVGCLVTAAWAAPRARSEQPAPPDVPAPVVTRLISCAVGWTWSWALSAMTWGIAVSSQVTGLPLHATLTSGAGDAVLLLPAGKALLLVVVTAMAVGLSLRHAVARGATALTMLAVLAVLATGPLLVSGHGATSSDHYLAAQSVLLHVMALTPWCGGLFVLVTHLRGHAQVLADVLPRYSSLAGLCFAVVALSGLAGAWTRLGLEPASWHSAYGALVSLKMLVLVLVGACGAAHRRWTIRAVRQGRTAGFLRLALGESLVMGLGIGLGVVLGRTTPPVGALTRAAPAHASAYPTVEAGLGPVDSSSLLLHVRPDALVLTTLVAAGAGAVWWRRRHCPDWSLRRLLVLQLGLVMVLWALCGGLGTYAVALVSAQVGQLMVLTLVAPTLIVLGAPPNLSGILPRRVVQRSEVDGLLAVVTVLLLVWCTPLLEVVLARPTARVLLALTCVVCGLALVGPLLSRWGHRRDPGVVLVVLATVLVTEAVQLGRPGGAVAGGWFVRLDWWWSDPVRDQRVAALILSVSAATLMVAGCSTLLWDRWHRGVRIPGSDHA